jgi:[ribosomal protein S5]-alanine N-acetyltransferase
MLGLFGLVLRTLNIVNSIGVQPQLHIPNITLYIDVLGCHNSLFLKFPIEKRRIMARKIPLSYKRSYKRIEIRLLKKSDFKRWLEMWSNFKKTRNQWDWAAAPLEKLTKENYYKKMELLRKIEDEDSEYCFGVFEKKSGKLIGYTMLRHFTRSRIQRSCEIGYQLSNIVWGCGFGSEAVNATLKIAFEDLELRRVEALIEDGNQRSKKLAKKVGMTRIGRSPKHFVFDRNPRDQIIYSITND